MYNIAVTLSSFQKDNFSGYVIIARGIAFFLSECWRTYFNVFASIISINQAIIHLLKICPLSLILKSSTCFQCVSVLLLQIQRFFIHYSSSNQLEDWCFSSVLKFLFSYYFLFPRPTSKSLVRWILIIITLFYKSISLNFIFFISVYWILNYFLRYIFQYILSLSFWTTPSV